MFEIFPFLLFLHVLGAIIAFAIVEAVIIAIVVATRITRG